MINLLPPDYKKSVRYARYNVRMLWYCAMVLAVAAGLAGIMFYGVSLVKADESSLKENIAAKEARISEKGNVEQEARQLAADINTIAALFKRSINFSELIQDIGAIIPNGARLTGLSLTEDTQSPLQITAVCDSQAKAAVLRQNIEDSGLFQGADIQSISPTAGPGGTEYTTVIVTAFVSAEKRAETQLDPNADVPEEAQD